LDFQVIDCLGKDAGISFPKLQPFYYPDKDGGWWLLEDFKIRYNGYLITALKGFDYDGASIPRIMRSIVGDKMSHDIIVPALFHDLFYCVHLDPFDRPSADSFFQNVAGVYGADQAKRLAIWTAVRSFGWSCWSQTPEHIDKYRAFIKIEKV